MFTMFYSTKVINFDIKLYIGIDCRGPFAFDIFKKSLTFNKNVKC